MVMKKATARRGGANGQIALVLAHHRGEDVIGQVEVFRVEPSEDSDR